MRQCACTLSSSWTLTGGSATATASPGVGTAAHNNNNDVESHNLISVLRRSLYYIRFMHTAMYFFAMCLYGVVSSFGAVSSLVLSRAKSADLATAGGFVDLFMIL